MDQSDFEFLEMLGEQAEIFTAPAGTVLFREGDDGDQMFIILEGEVRLTINGQALGMEGDGGIIGEMAMIEQTRRSATAIAVSDCTLVPLNLDGFIEMVRKKPEFAVRVMKVLSHRLRLANEILNLF